MIEPKHEHSNRDVICTPNEVAKTLVQKIPAKRGDSWCDPCYGNGAFFNNFPDGDNEYYEISMGKNFLPSIKKYDWLATNIPFSQPKVFIYKMAECSKKGFGILCLANSMTASRLNDLREMGLHLFSLTVLYIRAWGFGYRTDFYIFTRSKSSAFDIIIHGAQNNNEELKINTQQPQVPIQGSLFGKNTEQ